MQENFKRINERVISSLEETDLDKINYELSKLDKPTIITGVGGSSVVSDYASKILSKKNHIITRNSEPRDLNYMDSSLYDNVLSCSYSGNNYGVEISFLNNLKHYLLSSKPNNREDIINLTYRCIDQEKSFISLAATLIPCTILLNYYLQDQTIIKDQLKDYNYNFEPTKVYEIFTGLETSTPARYLESTLVESGIGIPIIHDKYSYCHGRSTTSINNNSTAIYFDTDKELDRLLLDEIHKYYQDVIVLKTSNNLLDEYSLLIKCMYLTKYIAEQNNKDLSGVDYNPIVKKLYKYQGNI